MTAGQQDGASRLIFQQRSYRCCCSLWSVMVRARWLHERGARRH
jgi:hypothetical protein